GCSRLSRQPPLAPTIEIERDYARRTEQPGLVDASDRPDPRADRRALELAYDLPEIHGLILIETPEMIRPFCAVSAALGELGAVEVQVETASVAAAGGNDVLGCCREIGRVVGEL